MKQFHFGVLTFIQGLSKCFHLNLPSNFFFTLCILQTHSVSIIQGGGYYLFSKFSTFKVMEIKNLNGKDVNVLTQFPCEIFRCQHCSLSNYHLDQSLYLFMFLRWTNGNKCIMEILNGLMFMLNNVIRKKTVTEYTCLHLKKTYFILCTIMTIYICYIFSFFSA